jgi:hypothetical protein
MRLVAGPHLFLVVAALAGAGCAPLRDDAAAGGGADGRATDGGGDTSSNGGAGGAPAVGGAGGQPAVGGSSGEGQGGAPAGDTAGSDAPATDAPATETPAADAPAAEAPAAEAPPACGPGLRQCGQIGCLSEAACTTECASCPKPDHGQPLCISGGCAVTCESGYHACDNKLCASESDPARCGPGCLACPAVANGQPACKRDRCDVDCNPGTLACTGLPPACVDPTWGFESNTAEGWAPVTPPESSAAVKAYPSTTRAHTGTHSLAIEATVNYARTEYLVNVEQILCAKGGLPFTGRTITMWVYFDGPQLGDSSRTQPVVYTTNGTSYSPLGYLGQQPVVPIVGRWLQIKALIAQDNPDVVARLRWNAVLNSDGWSGTIYLDDITIR